MKTIIITNGACAVLLLASSMAVAETQYPAADFQPKVVYQDPDYKPSSQPSSQAAAPVADSKYPAANFQPKVVYNDPDYRPSQSSASAPAQTSASGQAAAESASDKKEDSGMTYFLGLIVLAVVGFILFRKGGKGEAKPAAPSASGYGATTGGSTNLTGVAKYINRASGTGVARYLEKQAKTAAGSSALTGVAKYLANKTETAKSTASTGVDKYLRNRG